MSPHEIFMDGGYVISGSSAGGDEQAVGFFLKGLLDIDGLHLIVEVEFHCKTILMSFSRSR